MTASTATTAIDRSDRPGHVGIVLLVAGLLVGAAIALGFIANEWGDVVLDLDDSETGLIVATFDLDQARAHRASMGFFRDRRPQLYGRLVEDI